MAETPFGPPRPWYVYLVRAANGALYCGISDNPQRRFAQHQNGRGARFFSSSPAVALVYVEAWASKGEALRHERLIKVLRKGAKEALVSGFAGRTAGYPRGEAVAEPCPATLHGRGVCPTGGLR